MFFRKSENYKKNRKRFHSIVSDPRFNYLEPVFNDLEQGIEVPDIKVLEAYKKFAGAVSSNTIAMAELHLVLVATIAVYKPNLIEELLERPLLMFYITYGQAVSNKGVIQFINNQLLHKDADPYGGLPNKKAMKWLKTFFPKNQAMVEKVMALVVAKEEAEG